MVKDARETRNIYSCGPVYSTPASVVKAAHNITASVSMHLFSNTNTNTHTTQTTSKPCRVGH